MPLFCLAIICLLEGLDGREKNKIKQGKEKA
jgi:hypothetical protein